MKISIIIPCYNESKTIKKIINRILEDKFYNKEIIVIDDYSTDGTRDILKNDLNNFIRVISDATPKRFGGPQ